MSTRNLPDPSDFLGNGSSSIQPRQDLGDVFNLNSASPCLTEDARANGETRDPKLPEKTGVFSHLHHVSPLESIRELVEMEDASERRSPGDGEFRLKESSGGRNTKYEPVATKKLDKSDTLDEAMASPTKSLESLRMEACSSEHQVPIGLDPQEEVSNLIIQQVQWSLFVDKVVTEHQLTSSDTSSGVLDVQLDGQSSDTPLPDLRDDKEDVEPGTQLTEESEADDKPNSDGEACVKEARTAPEADQTLIEILTACESKVEQLEKLKSSSFQLSNQLHSAQTLAARLHRRVLHLERECRLKEKELSDLTAKLETTSKALQQRNLDTAALSEELQRLQLETEAEKNATAASGTVSVNGQAAPDTHRCDNGNSSVCTLL